ncbi:MAG TPA: condensation domain-containing protein, partial [Candidatus Deferrimicrobium sp.]|nr:condensation domain-containing protein [Candidatus Deferrimicrobium sp.]
EMVQAIAGRGDFNMTYWELDEAEALARIPALVQPFDLSRAPLLRVVLIKVQEQNYIIFFDMHHIISDRGSIEIVIDNIFRLYQGENMKPLQVQYKDYVARLEKQLKDETLPAQEKYWLNRLQGFIFTRLPIDYLKPGDRVKGNAQYHEIGPGFYHKIDHFCIKHNVTKFIFLITVFQLTLARKLDQWDIALGIPSAIRDNPDLKQVIGVFLNILLIRTAIDYNEPFLNHLSKSKTIVIGALDNQDYPYEMLIDKIRADAPANKNELFSILFNYITMDTDQKRTFPGFQINPLTMPEISPRYDITVYGHEGVDRINLSLVYKSDIYSEDSIRKLLTDFLETVQRALDDCNMTITQLTTWDRPDTYDMDKDSEIDMYYNRGESL